VHNVPLHYGDMPTALVRNAASGLAAMNIAWAGLRMSRSFAMAQGKLHPEGAKARKYDAVGT
jgi:hypothetical protein